MGKICDFKTKLEDRGWEREGRGKEVRSQEGLRGYVSFSPGLYMPFMWLGRRQVEKSGEGSMHYEASSHLPCGCAVLLRKQPGSWEEGDGNSRVTEINRQRMIGN